jgi:hypothetical protein
MYPQTKRKLIDIFVLIVFTSGAVVYAYLTRNTYAGTSTISGFMFLIPSVVYLALREKKQWNKIIIATLLFGGIFGFIFEFIAEHSQAYHVTSTLFQFQILGVLPIDNVLGHMMMTMLTVIFYEHFVDRLTNSRISKNIFLALIPGACALLTILILYKTNNLPSVQYPYLWMGLAAIVSPILLSIKRPQFFKNMAVTAVYFFFLYFLVEIIAVSYSWWIYPGTYIGWVHVATISFPIEELLFWMLFYAATLVSFYEWFIDIHEPTTIK